MRLEDIPKKRLKTINNSWNCYNFGHGNNKIQCDGLYYCFMKNELIEGVRFTLENIIYNE